MFSDEIHALEQENNAPVSCYRDGWHDMIVAKQQIGFFKEGRLKKSIPHIDQQHCATELI
jgi:hypothetical protein